MFLMLLTTTFKTIKTNKTINIMQINKQRIENKLRKEIKIFKELKRIQDKEFRLKNNIDFIKSKLAKKKRN